MNNVIHKGNGFKKGLLVLVVAMSFWLGSVASGLAAPMLTFSGLVLTGATGIVVGSTTYDLTLMDDMCVALFDGCDSVSDFPFPTLLGIQDANTAFGAVLSAASFEYSGVNAFGCSGMFCDIITPYGIGGAFIQFATVTLVGPDVFYFDGNTVPLVDLGANAEAVFAVWTASAPIPEPTTMLLLSTGLLGLVGYRWRQGRREGQQVG